MFQMGGLPCIYRQWRVVSVPLRGKMFQIYILLCVVPWAVIVVSVPLRGKMFQIEGDVFLDRNALLVSVPLRGKMFQITLDMVNDLRVVCVSVPLRGKMFQIGLLLW